MEVLESREAPCASLGISESFDGTAPGGLPADWSQWSSTGAAAFAVSATRAFSAPNGLAATASLSSLSARAWLDAAQPADLQVNAAVYVDSLIPAQVLARGMALDTSAASYYAVAVTRGLNVKLVRVVNGVATTLGQLTSATWFSQQWVCATLYASGTNLRAQVFRPDTAQYLNAAGQWQADAAWALNVTDTALATGGQVGLARPSSYTGTITFDDFAYVPQSNESQPPTVTLTAPADGATLTGVTTVQADATDNIGVTKVEFYVDNVLRAIDPAAPYRWDFDTSTVANGAHTLTAQAYDAAGNIGQASITVTTQNDASLPRPVIARHYPHIRIAQLAYSGNPMGAFEDQLLSESVDLVIPHSAYLEHIDTVAPATPQLIYSNASNLYLDLLTDWLTYADAQGLAREGAFYHVVAATPFSGDSPSSQPVTWFWRVYQGGTPLTDLTARASGTQSGGVTFGAAGEAVYVGYPDRFREINLNLASGASGGWSAVLEYVTAVDAAGNPTAWAPLPVLSDTTAGLTQSGRITFDPPGDWQTATLGGTARLFYVRFRTTASGTAPVANTLLGRDYVTAGGTTAGIIPAFDAAADANGDGYLTDAEYAGRTAGRDARFVYESRAFHRNYGQMRFSTNPADLGFKGWVVDYHVRYLNGQPLADGLFMDNSEGKAPVAATAVLEPVGAYAGTYAALLNAIGQAIAPRWILANTAGGGTDADAVVQKVQGFFEEFAIRPLAHQYVQFEDLAATVARRAALSTPAPYAVLDSLPTGGSPTDARTQLATLAYYYQLADPETTFLDFYGGFEPASPWARHWSAAAAYDIGQPLGAWSVFATGADPGNPSLTYRIYQRSYTGALVLYKPLSYAGGLTGALADSSATTHVLDGTYYPLQADGTLGAAVTAVTLRNGEGAILVRSATPALTISISDSSITEGASGTVTAVFTVSLSAASSSTVTVDYATADGTATAASGDYVAQVGILTFAPGVTSLTISVPVNGDTTFEPDETFFVNLTNASMASLADPQGQGTIINDDSQPALSIGDVTVTEGNSGTVNATFVVSLSNASYQAITVSYATADGTATAGTDYTAVSGTLTFDPGVTSLLVAVPVRGDILVEGNETFLVNLSNVSAGATLADSQGVGTIVNDDAPGSVNDLYVWDIVFESRTRGKGGAIHDERIAVVVRRDSDGDGVAESTDELVARASITVVLTGPVGGTFSGVTDNSGVYRTTWLADLPDGTYTAEVTSLSHATLAWNRLLDATANDTDVDGDDLPDQQHTIPHAG
jgi:hypothetical protein